MTIEPFSGKRKGNIDSSVGLKYDQGKRKWSLLPWSVVSKVVDVLGYGADKYAPDNWKHVDNWRERYFNAMQRHILAWWDGERNDHETGYHHLAHAGCCLLFLLARDLQEEHHD